MSSALPIDSRAQGELDLVPYAGLYLPTASVMDNGPKQQASPTLGTRVTMWLSRRAGIEGTLNYALSSLTGPMPVNPSAAHVTALSAKLLVRLNPPGAKTAVHVGGGWGRVGYGGPAYCGCNDLYLQGSGTTFSSWIAAVGAAFRPGRSISLRLDAEDYVFRTYFACRSGGHSPGVCNYGTAYSHKLQNDLVVSLGAAIRLGAQSKGRPSS